MKVYEVLRQYQGERGPWEALVYRCLSDTVARYEMREYAKSRKIPESWLRVRERDDPEPQVEDLGTVRT